jgi:glutathione S-transferase
VRLVYVLAGRPYEDVLHQFADAQAVGSKNPFRQFPIIETASGQVVYQSLAIMHHAAHGTSAWPSEPDALTRALSVALGGYDLYRAFAGFSADDPAAKKKFEERRAPQYLRGLSAIYASTPFATGDTPTFADCITYEAIAWVVRRNEVCKALLEQHPSLVEFRARFSALPKIRAFMERQAAARAIDPAV